MIKKISKTLFVICLLFFTTILTSCELPKSDDEIVSEMVEKIISSLENEDREKFRSLFALSKVNELTNFDESITDIFKYYEGKFVSESHPGSNCFQEKEGKFKAEWFKLSIDVATDNDEYRIATYWCTNYSTDSNFVGIWSLYIIRKAEDSTPDFSYGGDGLWTPGINIGKVYVKH